MFSECKKPPHLVFNDAVLDYLKSYLITTVKFGVIILSPLLAVENL